MPKLHKAQCDTNINMATKINTLSDKKKRNALKYYLSVLFGFFIELQ